MVLQGTLPFMSTQLLFQNSTEEHSEKHDLESIFYVLLYICTMCQGPGKRWDGGDRANVYHPFGEWIDEETRWHGIALFRMGQFSDADITRKEVWKHITPYFAPLIPLLENFCNVIFRVVEVEGRKQRCLSRPSGSHAAVLGILNDAFIELPDTQPDVTNSLTDAQLANPSPPNTAPSSTIVSSPIAGSSHGANKDISSHSDSGYEGETTSRRRSVRLNPRRGSGGPTVSADHNSPSSGKRRNLKSSLYPTTRKRRRNVPTEAD